MSIILNECLDFMLFKYEYSDLEYSYIENLMRHGRVRSEDTPESNLLRCYLTLCCEDNYE